MFPEILTQRNTTYQLIQPTLTEMDIKELFLQQPYEVFAVVNESLENEETMFTTFIVLYAVEFENNVILYDVSRQQHSTITSEIYFLAQGYIEIIDVAIVERYPVRLYKKVVTP
jgi:hypothetical protein